MNGNLMTADTAGHGYAAGDKVVAVFLRGNSEPGIYTDTVARVTAASVITSAQGAFRFSRMDRDRVLRRTDGGTWGTSVRVYPWNHPQAVEYRKQRYARRRRDMRYRVAIGPAMTKWTATGDPEDFNTLVNMLTAAQIGAGIEDDTETTTTTTTKGTDTQ